MALPGTLGIDADDVDQGTVLTMSYTVSADKVSSANWVGIWPDPGQGPVSGQYVGPQVTYRYAPGATGAVSLSSGIFKAGRYLAFYLYDDGYSLLAPPVGFTVHDTPQLPGPRFEGDFGNHKGRHGLDAPAGMAVDRTGRFWVTDRGSRQVHVFTRRGRPLGSFGAGVLVEPLDVAVGRRRVYVADATSSRVEEFTLSGRHLGSLGAGEVDRPRGVEVDQHGQVLVADVGNNRVARFDSEEHDEPTGARTEPSSVVGLGGRRDGHGIASVQSTKGDGANA